MVSSSLKQVQKSMLNVTARDLQQLLGNGSLTSEMLLNLCLHQIESFDQKGPHLRAMINVAPREKLLAQARLLDSERQAGKIRGPLHGIPIVLKVWFSWKRVDMRAYTYMLTGIGHHQHGPILATAYNTRCKSIGACSKFWPIDACRKGSKCSPFPG